MTTKKEQQYKKGMVVTISPTGLKKKWAHGGTTAEMPANTKATIVRIADYGTAGGTFKNKIYVFTDGEKNAQEWCVSPEEIKSYEPPVLPAITVEEMNIYALVRTACRAVNAAEIAETPVILDGKSLDGDALTNTLGALHKKKLVAVIDRDKDEQAVFKRYFTRSLYRDLADNLLVEKGILTEKALGLADKQRVPAEGED